MGKLLGDKTWGQHSSDAAKNAFSSDNLGSTLGTLGGGISGVIDAGMKNAEIADTSGIHSSIDATANTEFNYSDYDSLMSGYNPNAFQSTGYEIGDVRGVSGGEMAMNTFNGLVSGASTGAQVGGIWGAVIGGAVGLGSGIAGIFAGNAKAELEADRLNAEAEAANKQYVRSMALNASNIDQGMFNNAAMNLAAFGGDLDTYDMSKVYTKNFKMKHRKTKYKGYGHYYAYGGQLMSGDWSNGVIKINEGDTHEKNPLGGVPMGVDQQGVPNLVEEGEVIFNDYVFSNRLKITDKQIDDMHLDPKLKDKTFAEAAKYISDESELRPLDNISKNTLIDGLAKLTISQEEIRMKKERQKLLRQLRRAAIQEQQVADENQEPMMSEIPEENPEMYTQQEEPQPEEREPRAYRGIREEMPDMYAYGGPKGNVFEGKGNYVNVLNADGTVTSTKVDWDPSLLKRYKLTGATGDGENKQLYYMLKSDIRKQKKINNPKYKAKQGASALEGGNDGSEYPGTNVLQAMPALGNFAGALASTFQEPDTTNADILAKEKRGIRNVSSRPISGYATFNPYDTNLQQTKVRNQTAGNIRNVLNTTSGNRSAALSAMLPYLAQGTQQEGDVYRQGLEYNDAQKLKVLGHNVDIDKFISQNGLQADIANQSADDKKIQYTLKELEMRDREMDNLQTARNTGWTNAFSALGELGNDIFSSKQTKYLADNGYFSAANGGKLRRKRRCRR